MAKSIITIPATIDRFTDAPIHQHQKRKVAGYARVSTDRDEQLTSYEAQVDYYTNFIKSHAEWEFVGLYTDEGKSATSVKYRSGFNNMIQDALDGKIQLILTKSVSRFARNTVDSLTTIRKLKEHGIEVWFEKENIRTFDPKVEILLTIMSSLAQEESRSISENCTWGVRKRFQDGKATVPFGRFLGYDRGEDGNLVINEEQAVIVRRIYGMFLQGRSPYAIAKQLTEEGIPTPGGKTKWGGSVIYSILGNEKFRGDARLQKVYTVDFLTKKKKRNEGQVPQYYVENSHPAIIEPAVFDLVQKELAARRPGVNRQSCTHIFSGKIKCGDCGSWYGSKVWHSNSKYRRTIWRCNHKFEGEKCTTPHLNDEAIKGYFLKALNKLCEDRDEIIAAFDAVKGEMYDTTKLESEQKNLQQEINVVAGLMQQAINENARVAQNQTAYEEKYRGLEARYDKVRNRLGEVERQIMERQAKRELVERFFTELAKQDGIITEFTDDLWFNMVECMTVYSQSDVRVTFKDGTEIRL